MISTSIRNHEEWGIYPVGKPVDEMPTREAIFLLGPPAVGKGEVANEFTRQGYTRYSSSTALKQFAKRNNCFHVLDQIASGDIVDGDVVTSVSQIHYEDFCKNRPKGVFDGWGRTPDEFKTIVPIFLGGGHKVKFLFLEAHQDAIVERSRRRARSDDASIIKRLRLYRSQKDCVIKKITENFGQQSLTVIDTTSKNIEEVLQDVIVSVYNQ